MPISTTVPSTRTVTTPSTTTVTAATPITVAYAISLVKCGDGKQNQASGLADAAAVLRHSIHQISIRNNNNNNNNNNNHHHQQQQQQQQQQQKQGRSKYDYKLYALVHRQAQACAGPLQDAGYEIRIVDPPVTAKDIRGSDYLRKTIHKEVCCGADEFIKLHAYNLPEPVFVHVDMDFIFLKPLDDLFDAILSTDSSKTTLHPQEQKQKREEVMARIPVDYSWSWNNETSIINNNHTFSPSTIDAFWTRDWPSTHPGRRGVYQAGFIVARRDPTVIAEAVNVVKFTNYTEGFGRDNGWGGLGYGGAIGSRAMQGLMAYFYDVVRPGIHVELDSCKFNHIGMHLIGPKQQCRTGLRTCDDCRKTPLEDIYSIHYTACRKPWSCVAVAAPGGRVDGAHYGNALDTQIVDVPHCLAAVRLWHEHRVDLENRVAQRQQQHQPPNHTNGHDQISTLKIVGEYRKEYFLGHCSDEKKYIPMEPIDPQIYGSIYNKSNDN